MCAFGCAWRIRFIAASAKKKKIEKVLKERSSKLKGKWEDLRIYKDGAYARFKQSVITNGVRGPEQVEIRVLEKDRKSNEWKIILVGVLKK